MFGGAPLAALLAVFTIEQSFVFPYFFI